MRIITFLVCAAIASAQPPNRPKVDLFGPHPLVTVDYLVPHVSTVPANAGRRVELFLRLKVQQLQVRIPGDRPKVVLMISGAGVSAVPAFDLSFAEPVPWSTGGPNYSWMEYLANAGFVVYAMDLTGYGLSPGPTMENPCNAPMWEQQLYLIPNPLAQPCASAYPYQLSSIRSDWDEIDTVVDYIRSAANVDKISLVAWSDGAARAAGYAAEHPGKVDRMFLFAPRDYHPQAASDPPADLPLPGAPMSVLGSVDLYRAWDNQALCGDQFSPDVRDVITSTMLNFDPIGSTWGTAGVVRVPNTVLVNGPFAFGGLPWGFNTTLANQITAPTMIIRGEFDTSTPVETAPALYDDLVAAPQRMFVHIACTSHYLLWENQHEVLLRASAEWLQQGTFMGQTNGVLGVDQNGQVHPGNGDVGCLCRARPPGAQR
jgi:pimeloyl-ACP methyl ester carboxylesterase